MSTLRRLGVLMADINNADLVSTLTDQADLFLFSYSPQKRALVAWSRNAEQILGARDSAIAGDGNLFLRHVHPDDRFHLLSQIERALEGKEAYRCTYRWIRPDNNECRWFHCRARLVEREGLTLFEGVVCDLSSEFTGTTSRLAGPDSLSAVLSAFPLIVLTLDRDLRIIRMNRPGHDSGPKFGDPQFKSGALKTGKPILDCFSDTDHRTRFEQLCMDVLHGRQPFHRTRLFEGQAVQNVEIVPLCEQNGIEGLLCMISDISETVRLEKQLAELNRAEGLRILASGVAHHFNNSLQSILGQAAVLAAHPDKIDLVAQAAKSIAESVNRSADLCRQMLTLPANAEAPVAPVDVNLTVMAATGKLSDLMAKGIQVAVTLGNVPGVSIPQSDLTEIITGIIRNSAEAVERQPGDQTAISVRTSERHLRDGEVDDLKSGRYICISITDSGKGMDSEARQRCFAPFFTTKDSWRESGINVAGSGLTLSRAFATVRACGGTIAVGSKPGAGSIFSLYLPVHPDEKDHTSNEPVGAESPEVLIVDDDAMVLSTVSSVLEDAGYRCATAENASQAFAISRAYSKSLKVVVLDAMLQGMDGAAISRRLRKLKPDLQILGFTGGSTEQRDALLHAGASTVLLKPVPPLTLRQAVGSLMKGEAARQAAEG